MEQWFALYEFLYSYKRVWLLFYPLHRSEEFDFYEYFNHIDIFLS